MSVSQLTRVSSVFRQSGVGIGRNVFGKTSTMMLLDRNHGRSMVRRRIGLSNGGHAGKTPRHPGRPRENSVSRARRQRKVRGRGRGRGASLGNGVSRLCALRRARRFIGVGKSSWTKVVAIGVPIVKRLGIEG